MLYIAHKRTATGEIQSVQEHTEGTSHYAREYGGKLGLEHMAELCAIYHDLGKECVSFSAYINGESGLRRGEIDHSYAGAKYLTELADGMGDNTVKLMIRLVSDVIISHHGLHDWIDDNGEDYFKYRIGKSDNYQKISKNADELCSSAELKELFDKAKKEYSEICGKIGAISKDSDKIKSYIKLTFYSGMLERVLLSVLVDADRTDTAEFMQGRTLGLSYDKEKYFRKAMERLNNKLEKFSLKTDEISALRMNISERCLQFAEHRVGACRLTVPTGGGKSLSAIRFAIAYCHKWGSGKIIYCAPYMSILEQNADVFREIMGEELFLEHHTDVFNSIDGQEELREYELRTDKWDSPFIATTLVQLLNTLFSAKMSAVRRMHQLCGSVIILDEVQAMPSKCINLFNLAVNFLTQICGASVILCSATQPSYEALDYPMLMDSEDSMTGDYEKDFLKLRRTVTIPLLKDGGYSYDDAAEFCKDKFMENGAVLFVVNTKAAASEIFDRFNMNGGLSGVKIVHLSTNMCPEHRRDAIKGIRTALENKEKIICITTQLIEAGVDISFPCVIRSLAGFDNAAQAAGRCNRNGEYGGACSVYIINLREEKLGPLKSIKEAQEVSKQMIRSGKYPDMLFPATMSDYFELYYNRQKEVLSYPVKDGDTDTTLLNLLSCNGDRKNLRGNNEFYGQAFATAGKKFSVIDDNDEKTVIVPYNDEAVRCIADLNSDIGIDEALEIGRRVQKYTVSVNMNLYRKLSDKGAVYQLLSGALALRKEYYNSESKGITLEAAEMELLYI